MTRASGEDFTVSVEYAQKDVTAFVVTPPVINNIDRVALERKHLHGVNDMVAAFVLKGGALDKSLCDRKMQIFTGLERFNLAMRFAREDVATSKRTGYQGPVILCSIRYTPVSGHFTTSEITNYLAASDGILIWYAPLKAARLLHPLPGAADHQRRRPLDGAHRTRAVAAGLGPATSRRPSARAGQHVTPPTFPHLPRKGEACPPVAAAL